MLFIRIFAFHWNIFKLVQIMIMKFASFFFFFNLCFSVCATFYNIISIVYEVDDFEPNHTIIVMV